MRRGSTPALALAHSTHDHCRLTNHMRAGWAQGVPFLSFKLIVCKDKVRPDLKARKKDVESRR